MVAGDTIDADQRGQTVDSHGRSRVSGLPGRRLWIRAWSLTRNIVLKFASIFSEIMEQTHERSQATRAEFLGPRRCKPRHLLQVVRQRGCLTTNGRTAERNLAEACVGGAGGVRYLLRPPSDLQLKSDEIRCTISGYWPAGMVLPLLPHSLSSAVHAFKRQQKHSVGGTKR